MPFVNRKSLLTLSILSGVALVATAGFVWSGIYNIGADDMHTKPVYAVLQALREKSIEHHARDLQVPDLTDAALIRSGAGNYDAMCTACHLSPGAGDTELSKGLYPVPPNFSRLTPNDPAHDFWVIKHGIKASGMPAWGKSMEDRYIWGMVAFLQQIPKFDTASYKALVASSGGHSHGGGESGGDHHPAGEAEDHHAEEARDHHDGGGLDGRAHGEPATGARSTVVTQAPKPADTTHVHADGKTHVHAPPPARSASESGSDAKPSGEVEPAPQAPADHADGHDHQH